MNPSVWNVSTYYVDGDTYSDDEGQRVRRELKPVKAMREALAQGADPNECGALFTAIEKGSIGHVQALVKGGADIDRVDEDGKAPLYRAVEYREHAKVDALLKAGADVAATDERGRTCLHVARPASAMVVLLEAGADPEAVDRDGRTPLSCAKTRGSVALLLEWGAKR